MSFGVLWVIAFLACFAMDFCWVFYVRRVKDGDPLKSALWAVALFLTAAVGTISYVTNHWLLIPGALGGFIATYIGVKWDSRITIPKEEKQ